MPMQVLLRALQPALKLPAPLAQWPLQLLYGACIVSFPSMRNQVRPSSSTHACRVTPLAACSSVAPVTRAWVCERAGAAMPGARALESRV